MKPRTSTATQTKEQSPSIAEIENDWKEKVNRIRKVLEMDDANEEKEYKMESIKQENEINNNNNEYPYEMGQEIDYEMDKEENSLDIHKLIAQNGRSLGRKQLFYKKQLIEQNNKSLEKEHKRLARLVPEKDVNLYWQKKFEQMEQISKNNKIQEDTLSKLNDNYIDNDEIIEMEDENMENDPYLNGIEEMEENENEENVDEEMEEIEEEMEENENENENK